MYLGDGLVVAGGRLMRVVERTTTMTNRNEVRVEQPLQGRPDFVVVKLPDGRFKYFGDGQPLTHAEFNSLNSLIEPEREPRPADYFTDDERAELDHAELERAAADRLAGRRQAALDRAGARLARAEQASYRALGEPEPGEPVVIGGEPGPRPDRMKGPAGELRRAEADFDEARGIQEEAWRARARLRNLFTTRARARMPQPAFKGGETSARVTAQNWRARLEATGSGDDSQPL
ncbi:MAG: hypothetical protein ACREJ5_17115 [Geminicoccaceae bacterium]